MPDTGQLWKRSVLIIAAKGGHDEHCVGLFNMNTFHCTHRD